MSAVNKPETSVVARVAARHKTAGEVRFIKDRGNDHQEWGWNPPGASERNIDPDFKFDAKNLEPVARTLRSALMALGHIQTARTTFTRIKGQSISPDGNIGGKGYVMGIKDIRKQLSNCDEALSSVTDTLHDELMAIHWHPDVDDSGGDPRARDQVKQIMDDVEEIKDDPEEWAGDEEADMDSEGGTGKTASWKPDIISRVASRYLCAAVSKKDLERIMGKWLSDPSNIMRMKSTSQEPQWKALKAWYRRYFDQVGFRVDDFSWAALVGDPPSEEGLGFVQKLLKKHHKLVSQMPKWVGPISSYVQMVVQNVERQVLLPYGLPKGAALYPNDRILNALEDQLVALPKIISTASRMKDAR